MTYRAPGIMPKDATQLALILSEELTKIATGFVSASQLLKLEVLTREPNRPRQGYIAYADGSLWNPGSGEGIYRYDGTNWKFLG